LIRAFALLLNQDDPKKCTALKLIKFGTVMPTRVIKHDMLVLNPFAGEVVCKTDKNLVDSLCVIDCSWNKAQAVLTSYTFLKKGVVRRIPALLAGNPVNYARLGRLSSVESMSACYYVLGEKKFAYSLLNKFKWGHTFLELNHDALEDYSAADNRKEVMKIESEYFGYKILENNV
jgi:rRNA small subunit aminocarboxypropyltransferase